MSRPSPPTERVKEILTLLASSDRALTLTQIARDLGMSTTTCQTVLASLTDGGFVVRSPTDRSFVLGPALVWLGRAARAITPITGVVESELESLHAKLELGCTAFAAVNDQLVLVSRVGAAGHFPVKSMAIGPFPLVAPFGAAIMAFEDPARVEEWLAEAQDLDRALHLRALLATIRSVGYNVSVSTPETRLALPQFDHLLRELEHDGHSRLVVREVLALLAASGSRGYLEAELDSPDGLSVTVMTAPVLGNHAALEVHVHVYQSNIASAEVREMGSVLLDACHAIEDQISGAAYER